MCAQREALNHRRQAAEKLAATCMALLPEPMAPVIERAFFVDPNIPADQAALLRDMD